MSWELVAQATYIVLGLAALVLFVAFIVLSLGGYR